MQKELKAIAICGPTAVGKTEFSINLAERIDAEIICCDSMQIYKYMNIGTAKPDEEERRRVTHHMTDFLDPLSKYSAADYARDALSIARDICNRGKIPVFTGGTGLYLEAVRSGRHSDNDFHDAKYVERLWRIATEKNGIEILYGMLKEIDPESAEAIHKNNVRRVIRALEIYHCSGMTKSYLDKKNNEKDPDISMMVYGLKCSSRDVLYDRINRRVDRMISMGLADETRMLLDRGYLAPETTASQAIGYKEMLPYITGKIGLAECIEDLKTASRHYAKRQITWFGSMDNIRWIDIDINGTPRVFSDMYLYQYN